MLEGSKSITTATTHVPPEEYKHSPLGPSDTKDHNEEYVRRARDARDKLCILIAFGTLVTLLTILPGIRETYDEAVLPKAPREAIILGFQHPDTDTIDISLNVKKPGEGPSILSVDAYANDLNELTNKPTLLFTPTLAKGLSDCDSSDYAWRENVSYNSLGGSSKEAVRHIERLVFPKHANNHRTPSAPIDPYADAQTTRTQGYTELQFHTTLSEFHDPKDDKIVYQRRLSIKCTVESTSLWTNLGSRLKLELPAIGQVTSTTDFRSSRRSELAAPNDPDLIASSFTTKPAYSANGKITWSAMSTNGLVNNGHRAYNFELLPAVGVVYEDPTQLTASEHRKFTTGIGIGLVGGVLSSTLLLAFDWYRNRQRSRSTGIN